MKQTCSCNCGQSYVIINSKPITRFVCHCLDCQRFTGMDISDECAFLLKSVTIPEINSIEFTAYSPFISFRRGKCGVCGSPVVSLLNFFSLLKFAFISSKNVSAVMKLPPIEAHTFYHRRVSEIIDSAPKYGGYWSSQLNIARILLKRVLKSVNA